MKSPIEPQSAEIRTIDLNARLVRIHKEAHRLSSKGARYGKLKKFLDAVSLHNVHESESFTTEGFKTWKAYHEGRGFPGTTERRYRNVAAKLIKLCPAAVIIEDGKCIFHGGLIEGELKKLLKESDDLSFDAIASIRNDEKQIENYFEDDNSGMSTPDVMSLLTSGSASATEETPATERTVAPYYDEFILAYAKEHGLLYDKKRGWLNNDGSELSEQQRVDMTLVEQAVACPQDIASSLAKFLKEIEHQIQHKADAYGRGLKKDSKPIHEAIDNHFRGALVAHERLGAAIGNLYEGNIEKALWCLKSSAEEFFGS